MVDRGLSRKPSIGQIRWFEKGYECMSIFREGLLCCLQKFEAQAKAEA